MSVPGILAATLVPVLMELMITHVHVHLDMLAKTAISAQMFAHRTPAKMVARVILTLVDQFVSAQPTLWDFAVSFQSPQWSPLPPWEGCSQLLWPCLSAWD